MLLQLPIISTHDWRPFSKEAEASHSASSVISTIRHNLNLVFKCLIKCELSLLL